jgi:hypothetical protein
LRKKNALYRKYNLRTKNERRRSSLFLELTGKVEEIETLKEKLKNREDVIKDMSVGYFKNLSHLSEMLTRGEQDLFEVNYFDMTKGLDENTQKVVQ